MILQALADYYRRKVSDPDSPLAPPGFEYKALPFIIVINDDGRFVDLEDTRRPSGKKLVAKSFLVPKRSGRSGTASWQITNILWDHYGYVLGFPKPDEEVKKSIELAEKQHSAFIALVKEISASLPSDEGIARVATFLSSPAEIGKVFEHPLWRECRNINGCNLTFRLAGSRYLVCQSIEVQRWVADAGSATNDEDVTGVCLVSGDVGVIARLHPEVTGVNRKPAPLAAVNDGAQPALSSFGKHQGFNFPVSKSAAFEYSTALSHLLASDQKFQLGDTKAVVWAARPAALEQSFPLFFSDVRANDPDSPQYKAIQSLFASIRNGAYVADDGAERFHVLGLAPNNARIAVRFWQTGTVADFSERIARYFTDLEIVGYKKYGYPSLFRLLLATAALHKVDNINPLLAGSVMRAVLEDLLLPEALLQSVIRRLHAERHVSYERAALIKACLNRKFRKHQLTHKEITVALDSENTDTGYRLGRLFALQERIQKAAANRQLNTTIRDRFYSAASSAPVTVFATLWRSAHQHLAKLPIGHRTYYEKLLGEVMSEVNDFPAHLRIEQQGQFAIGYYHQRQALFQKHAETVNELAEA